MIRRLGDRASDAIANAGGSWPFILLHILWFGSWMLLHLDINLLTLLVSLEAIFIGAFVMMSQRRSSLLDRAQAARIERLVSDIADSESRESQLLVALQELAERHDAHDAKQEGASIQLLAELVTLRGLVSAGQVAAPGYPNPYAFPQWISQVTTQVPDASQ